MRSRKNTKSAVLFTILVSALCVWLWPGCEEIQPPLGEVNLIGQVRDAETGDGIRNVFVQVQVAGVTAVWTDTTGTYRAGNVPPGTFNVLASKSGYTSGVTETVVTADGWRVNAIFLSPLSPGVFVSTRGGVVETPNVSGKMVQLEIPAGALTGVTEISVTPLHGTQIPGLPPPGKLSGAAVVLDSSVPGLTLGKPATLTVPLPFRHQPGSQVSVSLLNPATSAWDNPGVMATVSADGMSASAQIDHFSTYSVDVDGTYEEEVLDAPGSVQQADVVYEDGYVWVAWESQIVYPGGMPDDFDPNWLVGTVEQQTGVRFSKVTDETTAQAAPLKAWQQPKSNISTYPLPPEDPPPGWEGYSNEYWEGVIYCCEVYETVQADVWVEAGGWILTQVNNTYTVCKLVWEWELCPSFPDDIPCPEPPPNVFVPPTCIPPTIKVTTNSDNATFTISGPATYSGSGKLWIKKNVPLGEYTITFGDLAGYTPPPPQTLTLLKGGVITFAGSYIAIHDQGGGGN